MFASKRCSSTFSLSQIGVNILFVLFYLTNVQSEDAVKIGHDTDNDVNIMKSFFNDVTKKPEVVGASMVVLFIIIVLVFVCLSICAGVIYYFIAGGKEVKDNKGDKGDDKSKTGGGEDLESGLVSEADSKADKSDKKDNKKDDKKDDISKEDDDNKKSVKKDNTAKSKSKSDSSSSSNDNKDGEKKKSGKKGKKKKDGGGNDDNKKKDDKGDGTTSDIYSTEENSKETSGEENYDKVGSAI